jgi:two-component system, OmpR family, response regulator
LYVTVQTERTRPSFPTHADEVVIDTRGPPSRILCIDDNHDVADSTAELLALFGYETRACYDGPTALILAEAFHPEACLIDLNMPGMDGDELAVRLRALADEKPVLLIAVSAASHGAALDRIRAAGYDHQFVKPAPLADILAALRGRT